LWRYGENIKGSRLVREFREIGEIADQSLSLLILNSFSKAAKNGDHLLA